MPRVRQRRQPGGHAMVQLPDHYCAKHYEHEAEYLATRQRWARSHHMAKHTSASTNRWPGTGARLSPSSGSYYASRYSIVTTMSANTAANLTVRRWTSWCQEERTHRNCLTQNEVNASLHTHYSNDPVEGVNNRIRSSTRQPMVSVTTATSVSKSYWRSPTPTLYLKSSIDQNGTRKRTGPEKGPPQPSSLR